jgi:hypothetical protein
VCLLRTRKYCLAVELIKTTGEQEGLIVICRLSSIRRAESREVCAAASPYESLRICPRGPSARDPDWLQPKRGALCAGPYAHDSSLSAPSPEWRLAGDQIYTSTYVYLITYPRWIELQGIGGGTFPTSDKAEIWICYSGRCVAPSQRFASRSYMWLRCLGLGLSSSVG